jgi:hypothetical protein
VPLCVVSDTRPESSRTTWSPDLPRLGCPTRIRVQSVNIAHFRSVVCTCFTRRECLFWSPRQHALKPRNGDTPPGTYGDQHHVHAAHCRSRHRCHRNRRDCFIRRRHDRVTWSIFRLGRVDDLDGGVDAPWNQIAWTSCERRERARLERRTEARHADEPGESPACADRRLRRLDQARDEEHLIRAEYAVPAIDWVGPLLPSLLGRKAPKPSAPFRIIDSAGGLTSAAVGHGGAQGVHMPVRLGAQVDDRRRTRPFEHSHSELEIGPIQRRGRQPRDRRAAAAKRRRRHEARSRRNSRSLLSTSMPIPRFASVSRILGHKAS